MRKTCVGNQSQARGVWEMKSEWTGQYSGDSSLWCWLEGATEAEFVTKPLPCGRLLTWRGKWRSGLPQGSLGRPIRVEVCGKRGIQNILCIDPGPFLWAVPFPVHKVLNYSAPVTRVQKLPNSVCLLSVYDNGGSPLVSSLLPVLHSSQTTSGLEQGNSLSFGLSTEAVAFFTPRPPLFSLLASFVSSHPIERLSLHCSSN